MDVISMQDFSKEQIESVLNVTEEVRSAIHGSKRDRQFFREKYGTRVTKLMKKKKVATLFCENSTRTNFSFRFATRKAGGWVEGFPSDRYTSLGKGETWAATVEQFAGWGVDAIVMRSKIEGLPRWTQATLREYNVAMRDKHELLGNPYAYKTPIVLNGGDGRNQHPTQCFLDLFTMRQLARSQGKELDGLEVALLNDLKHGRTNASLMSVAHHFDWKLHLAYPDRFGPQKKRLRGLQIHGIEPHDHGTDFMAAMDAADIAYHSRPQKERVGAGEDLLTIKKLGQITSAMYDQLGDNAPFLMHPLPVDAATFAEIAPDMKRHPLNMTDVQSENGLYVRIALLALGLDVVHDDVYHSTSPFHLRELSINVRDLNSNPKHLENPRSGYVSDAGVVIDHIPAGMGRRLEGILGFEHTDLPIGVTRNLKGEGGEKDMIKIRCTYEPTERQYEAMALVAPGVTVNFIEGGKVVRKVQPVSGNYVEGLVECGNKSCVSNLPYESAPSRHHLIQNGSEGYDLECRDCEVVDTTQKARHKNRFIYLDSA
ncbi:TPA: hypothetical protein HA278_01610 [Candidatus Woesearchaeota archaeon]|nr:hypothetical protein [Candidatus Woesearchaeota archaeon]